ncbi:MAG: hypothetical protein ACRDS0_11235 [Pseudonocardiaceae bacterium]
MAGSVRSRLLEAGRRDGRPHQITPGAASLAGSEVLRNKWVQGGLIAVCLFLIYFATGNKANPYNQDVRLADAFLHGRVYLVHPPDYLELARYNDNGTDCKGSDDGCKGYVIDPPLPAVLMMPLVAIFGTDLNQVFVSLALGAAAMGLFWVATRQMGWGRQLGAAMTVLLALGTNFWWAAGEGSLWSSSHVFSMFFMMTALVVATGPKRPWLVGLLLGLSGLARLPTFLAFPFFLYLVLKDDIPDWRDWRAVVWNRGVIRKVLQFGGGLGAMASMVVLYNYARYGTILDHGYDHPVYTKDWQFAEGIFSISYIPRHIRGIFFYGPEPIAQFPFFKPAVFGMALFMVTPAFLYAYRALAKRLEVAAALAMGLVMIPHVLYAVTGGGFGYRFSLDYLPMLAVLTASGMGHRVGIRGWLAIVLSVLVAIWGPLYFFDTRLEDVLGHQWTLQ